MIETIRSAFSELRQAREDAIASYSASCSTAYQTEQVKDLDWGGKLISYPAEVPYTKDDGDFRLKQLADKLAVQIAALEAIVEEFQCFDIEDHDPGLDPD